MLHRTSQSRITKATKHTITHLSACSAQSTSRNELQIYRAMLSYNSILFCCRCQWLKFTVMVHMHTMCLQRKHRISIAVKVIRKRNGTAGLHHSYGHVVYPSLFPCISCTFDLLVIICLFSPFRRDREGIHQTIL
jgi:hypothetical protein